MAFATAAHLSVRAAPARAAVSPRTAPAMAMSPRTAAARAAAALPAALAALPALATEGTGEPLGIDNPLLLLPLIVIPGTFLFLFLGFARSQVNEGLSQRPPGRALVPPLLRPAFSDSPPLTLVPAWLRRLKTSSTVCLDALLVPCPPPAVDRSSAFTF